MEVIAPRGAERLKSVGSVWGFIRRNEIAVGRGR